MARKIVLAFGTRPEAIKMAPVARALAARTDEFACRVCVTAQHREMLDQALAVFDLHADHDLDVMTPNQDLSGITSRVLDGMCHYLGTERPDLVLVHGDTTSTFACALAAFYCGVPVGHVEAGLRTGDPRNPFPEEMNRRLAGALCELHFSPTPESRDNLLREGVAPERIVVTGNTAIDALRLALASPALAILPRRFPAGRRGVLVTAHRRENFGEGIRAICRALRRLATARPDLHLIYPVHPNPNICGPVGELLGGLSNVELIEPVAYAEFVRLMADCHLILTDSGGVQEEAPSLGKPVLVLRDQTERPEAVRAGTVRLVGTDEARIVAESDRLLDDPAAYESMARAVNPYGDGRAATRIVAFLRHRFTGEPWPGADLGEFVPAAD